MEILKCLDEEFEILVKFDDGFQGNRVKSGQNFPINLEIQGNREKNLMEYQFKVEKYKYFRFFWIKRYILSDIQR